MMLDAWLHGDQARAIALIERELDRTGERHDLAQAFSMLIVLAEFRFEMGQGEAALTHIRRALTLDPPEGRVPYLRYVLAVYAAHQGDQRRARWWRSRGRDWRTAALLIRCARRCCVRKDRCWPGPGIRRGRWPRPLR